MTSPFEVETADRPDKRPRKATVLITFGVIDLEGMTQPHDDALVVTFRIWGFLVKRVTVDQGSETRGPEQV